MVEVKARLIAMVIDLGNAAAERLHEVINGLEHDINLHRHARLLARWFDRLHGRRAAGSIQPTNPRHRVWRASQLAGDGSLALCYVGLEDNQTVAKYIRRFCREPTIVQLVSLGRSEFDPFHGDLPAAPSP